METIYFSVANGTKLTLPDENEVVTSQALRFYVVGQTVSVCHHLVARLVAKRFDLLTFPEMDIDQDFSEESAGLGVDIDRAQTLLSSNAIDIVGAVEVLDEAGFRELYVVAKRYGEEQIYHQQVIYGEDGRAIAYNQNHLVIAGRLTELFKT